MITPRKKLPAQKLSAADLVIEPGTLIAEIRQLIIAARSQAAQAVNVALTMLYWQIGTRIRQDILKNALKQDFYAEMCRMERWSVRTLRRKIDGMLYERTALSKKPDQLIRQELDKLREEDKLTPDLVFQDPYLLDFLGLNDTYRGVESEVRVSVCSNNRSFLGVRKLACAFVT